MRWTVLIAVKALPDAKSRLLPASRDASAHALLVEAIRSDTIAAARAARDVARVVLVADRPGACLAAEADGLTVLVQHSPGLNGALRDAAGFAGQQWPAEAVAALVGDLPALAPDALTSALDAAAGLERAYVADAAGTGTTLLTALPGVALLPEFGTGSARRHALHSVALVAGETLRTDVDTLDDLEVALRLGVGPATSHLLGRDRPIHLDTAPIHLDTAPLHLDTAPIHLDTAPIHLDTA